MIRVGLLLMLSASLAILNNYLFRRFPYKFPSGLIELAIYIGTVIAAYHLGRHS